MNEKNKTKPGNDPHCRGDFNPQSQKENQPTENDEGHECQAHRVIPPLFHLPGP